MKTRRFRQMLAAIFSVAILLCMMACDENIDPDNDDSQYAWSENVGWIDLEPEGDGGPGVEVADAALTGFMWGENVGWISLSCENTLSCDTMDYGVTNDGNGNLSGYAWGEDVGWISFSCKNTDTCTTTDYGVKIDPVTGEFSGFAWGENIGWIDFAPNGAGAKTSWRRQAVICSTLGNDPRPHALDQDTFKFNGTGGETVTIRLEADPPEAGLGQRTTLVLRNVTGGLQLFRRLNTGLPHEITVTLPVSGEYHVLVGEQLGKQILWGEERYIGDYCVALQASLETLATFEATASVE